MSTPAGRARLASADTNELGDAGTSEWTSWRRIANLRKRFVSPPRDGRRSLARRALRVGVIVLVVLLVAAAVAARWGVPYYAITPGTALDVGALISVPRNVTHSHHGRVILTDVELTQLSALAYAYYYLQNRSEIVSAAAITGGASSQQYEEQGVIDMATARQAAALVALRALGYRPRAVPSGVVVYVIEPGAPPRAVPAVGDVITAIGATPVARISTLVDHLNVLRPGSTVTLAFHLLGKSSTSTRSYTIDEFLQAARKPTQISCEPPGTTAHGVPVQDHGRPVGCLPFGGEQIYRNADLPFSVSIRANGIVGPSAGLSFTLGLIEKLDTKDLTAGHRVAATGTMSNSGEVGAVGGVAEKTIAVRAAGATVFLVPPSGLAAARLNAGPNLTVVAVSSVHQAIAALERLGGRLAAQRHLAPEP